MAEAADRHLQAHLNLDGRRIPMMHCLGPHPRQQVGWWVKTALRWEEVRFLVRDIALEEAHLFDPGEPGPVERRYTQLRMLVDWLPLGMDGALCSWQRPGPVADGKPGGYMRFLGMTIGFVSKKSFSTVAHVATIEKDLSEKDPIAILAVIAIVATVAWSICGQQDPKTIHNAFWKRPPSGILLSLGSCGPQFDQVAMAIIATVRSIAIWFFFARVLFNSCDICNY